MASVNYNGIVADLMASQDNTAVVPYTTVPSSGPEFPALYMGFPTILTDYSSTGACSMSISVILAVSRASGDMEAQQQLGDLLGTDIISRLMRAQSDNWTDIAFTSVNNFRHAKFANAEVLAADINLQLRTT